MWCMEEKDSIPYGSFFFSFHDIPCFFMIISDSEGVLRKQKKK